MFLDVLRRRNPDFIRAAQSLHQAGMIPANSYVLDLDAVTENARLLRAEGDRLGLKVYAMTKQVSRNTGFSSAVMAGGIDRAVAEGTSSAEFRHGPLALADNDTAALVFVLDDVTRTGTESLVETFRQRGTTVVTLGAATANQSGAGLMHPATQAIAAITAFYGEVQALAVSLGLDPDVPPHLVKATLTKWSAMPADWLERRGLEAAGFRLN